MGRLSQEMALDIALGMVFLAAIIWFAWLAKQLLLDPPKPARRVQTLCNLASAVLLCSTVSSANLFPPDLSGFEPGFIFEWLKIVLIAIVGLATARIYKVYGFAGLWQDGERLEETT